MNDDLMLDFIWRDAGVLDPDQPTPWSHRLYVEQAQSEFSPVERQMIRACLGLPTGAERQK